MSIVLLLLAADLAIIVLNIIRMIKLFGWEGKTKEQVNEKREEELKYIWKRKILVVLIDNAK